VSSYGYIYRGEQVYTVANLIVWLHQLGGCAPRQLIHVPLIGATCRVTFGAPLHSLKIE
jgi:hypothetical protein